MTAPSLNSESPLPGEPNLLQIPMIFLSCPTSLKTPPVKRNDLLFPPNVQNLSRTLSASEWLFPGHVITP